jgi:hypothetical protein
MPYIVECPGVTYCLLNELAQVSSTIEIIERALLHKEREGEVVKQANRQDRISTLSETSLPHSWVAILPLLWSGTPSSSPLLPEEGKGGNSEMSRT